MPTIELRYGTDAEAVVSLGQYSRGDLARGLSRFGIAIETLPQRLEDAIDLLRRRGLNLTSEAQGELAVILKRRLAP